MPGDGLAGHGRVGVDQRGDPETAGGEAAVVGERGAEVTDTDDDDRPVLGEPELTGDLVDEVLDVVADAARPVGAEVGEVLAQLGGVDPRRGGELLGGDRGDRALGERGQCAQIQRKPGDGGLGNPSATGRRSVSSASCHGAPAGRAGLRAAIRSQTAPSNAGYVFVNACTKMVSDLPGQSDRGHAHPSRDPRNLAIASARCRPEGGKAVHTPHNYAPEITQNAHDGNRVSLRTAARCAAVAGSTRQNVCCSPSTRTTGICSQYSRCSSSSWVMSFSSQDAPSLRTDLLAPRPARRHTDDSPASRSGSPPGPRASSSHDAARHSCRHSAPTGHPLRNPSGTDPVRPESPV